MRIAHLVPPGVDAYSGVLTALTSLVAALARQGIAVELWQVGEWPSGAEELENQLSVAGAQRVQFSRARGPFRRRAPAHRMSARAVDLVHLHGVFHPFNIRVAHQLRVPYIVSPHGGYARRSLEYHAARKQVFKWLFEGPMLRRARAVCALTETEAQEVRWFGVKVPVPTIPNGVELPPETIDRCSFRRELGVSDSSRLAVYVGRMDVRAKRLDSLVRGIRDAHQWHLALVGGDFRGGVEHLRDLINEYRVAERVHIVGPKRGMQLHEVFAGADLFMLLSRSEGMPMALLEAASHGVPALVSPEVESAVPITTALAGWTSSPGDLPRSLQAIDRLDPAEWRTRRSAAKSFASRYSWSAVATRYVQLYETIIERGLRGTD